MGKAWKLLDLKFGDLQELRAKLKDQVQGLKIKAVKNPAHIMELFQQIQTIAAKIKTTDKLSILKNYEEYVVLVSNHLSKEVMWRCWEQDKTSISPCKPSPRL